MASLKTGGEVVASTRSNLTVPMDVNSYPATVVWVQHDVDSYHVRPHLSSVMLYARHPGFSHPPHPSRCSHLVAALPQTVASKQYRASSKQILRLEVFLAIFARSAAAAC